MIKAEGRPKTAGTYLVVLADYLVAQDLAESIVVYDADAEVLVLHSASRAAAALEKVERIAVAFVDAGPELFGASELAQMIQSRGGRVVLLGDEAEAAGGALGWSVLQRPF